jgi:hypothetical protein
MSVLKLGTRLQNVNNPGQRGPCCGFHLGRPVFRAPDGKLVYGRSLRGRKARVVTIRVLDGAEIVSDWFQAQKVQRGYLAIDDPVFAGCVLDSQECEVMEVRS